MVFAGNVTCCFTGYDAFGRASCGATKNRFMEEVCQPAFHAYCRNMDENSEESFPPKLKGKGLCWNWADANPEGAWPEVQGYAAHHWVGDDVRFGRWAAANGKTIQCQSIYCREHPGDAVCRDYCKTMSVGDGDKILCDKIWTDYCAGKGPISGCECINSPVAAELAKLKNPGALQYAAKCIDGDCANKGYKTAGMEKETCPDSICQIIQDAKDSGANITIGNNTSCGGGDDGIGVFGLIFVILIVLAILAGVSYVLRRFGGELRRAKKD